MKRVYWSIASAGLLLASGAQARWTEMIAGTRAQVANSKLAVIAPARWNRSSSKLSKKSEMWSYDGPLLNRLDFFAAVGPGEALLKEINKKRNPLPKFLANMQTPDVAEMYERTYRIAADTSDFVVDTVVPSAFAGRKGFRFTFHYTESQTLTRKGIATGAIIDGKLYLITYSAPALYYFDTGLKDAQAVMDSASL